MILNLNINSGVIKDEDGRIVSLEDAKEAWEAKRVTTSNRYFKVLVGCDFNIEATKMRFKGWLEEEK